MTSQHRFIKNGHDVVKMKQVVENANFVGERVTQLAVLSARLKEVVKEKMDKGIILKQF